MADILRIKRRAVGGAAGPPATLNAAELAYNEQDDTLYYGKGNSSGAATSIVPVAGSGAFQNNVGRNTIQNPYFNVQQRGVGAFTTNNVYTADRWQININGSDTASVGLLAASDGSRAAVGDEACQWLLYATVTGNSAGGSNTELSQKIENVRRLAGKTVTVSFWAAASSGTPLLGINLLQYFGVGGSPSAAVWALGTGASVTLTTGLARYSVTIPVPSASGKTFGTTTGSDLTQLMFFYSSSTGNPAAGVGVQSNTFYLWGVQLEIGSVATPLEKVDPGEDLRRCQRFYQVYTGIIVAGYAAAGGGNYTDFTLSVPLRALPTIAFSNTSYFNANTLVLNSAFNNHIRFGITFITTAAGYALSDFTASADL